MQRIGEQSYRLALPPHLHVHNVFHVSSLKHCVPNPNHILSPDDSILVTREEFHIEPEQIPKVKEKQLHNRAIREVLVQWKGYLVEDASWEYWNHLLNHFPYLQS